jgi:hypothetical protein
MGAGVGVRRVENNRAIKYTSRDIRNIRKPVTTSSDWRRGTKEVTQFRNSAVVLKANRDKFLS